MESNIINLQKISFKSFWIYIREICRFFVINRSYSVFILILTLCLLYFYGAQVGVVWNNMVTEIDQNNTGTVINLVTLVFIVALWLANIISGWKETLPKYLSVKFEFIRDGKNEQRVEEEALTCKYIFLTSEADIRAFSQQLGQQKNDNARLPLDSTQYQVEKSLQYDCNRVLASVPFWHFDVTMVLTKPLEEARQDANNRY